MRKGNAISQKTLEKCLAFGKRKSGIALPLSHYGDIGHACLTRGSAIRSGSTTIQVLRAARKEFLECIHRGNHPMSQAQKRIYEQRSLADGMRVA